jgi:hypothetical protein
VLVGVLGQEQTPGTPNPWVYQWYVHLPSDSYLTSCGCDLTTNIISVPPHVPIPNSQLTSPFLSPNLQFSHQTSTNTLNHPPRPPRTLPPITLPSLSHGSHHPSIHQTHPASPSKLPLFKKQVGPRQKLGKKIGKSHPPPKLFQQALVLRRYSILVW